MEYLSLCILPETEERGHVSRYGTGLSIYMTLALNEAELKTANVHTNSILDSPLGDWPGSIWEDS